MFLGICLMSYKYYLVKSSPSKLIILTQLLLYIDLIIPIKSHTFLYIFPYNHTSWITFMIRHKFHLLIYFERLIIIIGHVRVYLKKLESWYLFTVSFFISEIQLLLLAQDRKITSGLVSSLNWLVYPSIGRFICTL